MYVGIYVRIYVCMYVHTYIPTYIYISTYTCMHIDAYMYVCVYSMRYSYMHAAAWCASYIGIVGRVGYVAESRESNNRIQYSFPFKRLRDPLTKNEIRLPQTELSAAGSPRTSLVPMLPVTVPPSSGSPDLLSASLCTRGLCIDADFGMRRRRARHGVSDLQRQAPSEERDCQK